MKRLYIYNTGQHRMWLGKNRRLSTRTNIKKQPLLSYERNLWHTTAEEDDDINKHLTNMKKYWEHLNLVEDERF